MRENAQCPKCEGSRFYACDNVQPNREVTNVVWPLCVFSVLISQKDTGASQGSNRRTDVGAFETWICAACGYTEWYAKDPEGLLEKLSRTPGSGVRVIER